MQREEALDRRYIGLSWEARTRRGPMFYFSNEVPYEVRVSVVLGELRLRIKDYEALDPEPGGLAGGILKIIDDRAYIVAMFEHYAKGLSRLL